MYRIFATLALFSLAACWSPPPASRRFALTPTVILSEVLFSLPGTDGNNEFVELQCTPGAALDSYWFVIVEGDLNNAAPNERGRVDFAKQLTGVTCGTTGYVILQRGGVYDEVTGTTYVDNFFTDNLEGGSQTYMLVDTAATVGTDLDGTDNDGVIDDLTFPPHILDCVAVLDEDTATDRAYCPAVVNATDATGAITRFGSTTTTNGESWYFGDVIDADPNPHFKYDPTNVSANFPVGGALTPGTGSVVDPNPPDLAGDFATASTDLASGATADLTGAPADDLTGVAPTDDLGSASEDLTGVAVDEDLAEPPVAAPDLRRARDLTAAPDLTEEPPVDAPDLSDGTTTGRDKGGCDCSTPPGPPDPAALFAAAGLLAILRRRRRA